MGADLEDGRVITRRAVALGLGAAETLSRRPPPVVPP